MSWREELTEVLRRVIAPFLRQQLAEGRGVSRLASIDVRNDRSWDGQALQLHFDNEWRLSVHINMALWMAMRQYSIWDVQNLCAAVYQGMADDLMVSEAHSMPDQRRSISGNWAASEQDLAQQVMEHPETKADALLRTNLTETQCQDYNHYQAFDITGGETGTVYRIHRGRQANIQIRKSTDLLLSFLRQRRLWPPSYIGQLGGLRMCAIPKASMPIGDILLTQKLALELRETDVLMTANIG
jgi:hypothetical protein